MSNLSKFDAPFPSSDIEWRIQSAGTKRDGTPWARVVPYVSCRAIQQRLDEVCGRENWQNEFVPGPAGGIVCKISIRIRGKWIVKMDGAENTNFEAVKGGLSGAMKRAAAQWGIGRYLYRLEEDFAIVSEHGKFFQKADKGGKYPSFRWGPPQLPEWALPADEMEQASATNGNAVNGLAYVVIRSDPYLRIIARPLKQVLDHADFVAAWPDGIEELKRWAMSVRAAGFASWRMVEQSEEIASLAELKNLIDIETSRRAVEASKPVGAA